MKAPIISIALLFVAGCASQPGSTGDYSKPAKSHGERYECYTYVGSNHVLTLPVPNVDAELHFVDIAFHGDSIPTIYQRDGLTQLWIFEDSLYIRLDPDLTAGYYDFRSAEEGELRKPDSVFECKKRR